MTTAADKQQVIRSNQRHTQACKQRHTHARARAVNNAARAPSLNHKGLIHDSSVRLEANSFRASHQKAPSWPDTWFSYEAARQEAPDACGYHFKAGERKSRQKKTPSTLLGMDMLIRQIVLRLSYSVYVRERKGKGAIFRVRLLLQPGSIHAS